MSELIRSLADIERLRPQWDDLHGRCAAVTPFQSPAWLLPWARQFAPDRCMAVLVREAGALVALLPFFAWRKRLLLAGCGPTDYCDGLFACGGSGADAALAELARYAEEVDCDCIDLQQLPAQSPLLAAAAPEHWMSDISAGTVCPVAPLPAGDPLATVSPTWRKNVAKARRKLARAAPVTLDCSSTQLFEGAAAEVIRLHGTRWQQRNQPGVFIDPLLRGFLGSALPELSSAGLLRLHTLHADSRPIAILFGVHHRAMTCFYIGGFDPEWAAYSPGAILLEAAMLQAARDGAVEFHFLRGCESYKYHFGARDRQTFNRVLARAPRAPPAAAGGTDSKAHRLIGS